MQTCRWPLSILWRHQIEKHFPRYWPFVRGIHRSPVNSSHKGQWRGDLMFSLIFTWINGWVNNLEVVNLRRHRAHYDITVMDHGSAHLTCLAGSVWHGGLEVQWSYLRYDGQQNITVSPGLRMFSYFKHLSYVRRSSDGLEHLRLPTDAWLFTNPINVMLSIPILVMTCR